MFKNKTKSQTNFILKVIVWDKIFVDNHGFWLYNDSINGYAKETGVAFKCEAAPVSLYGAVHL